MRNRSLRIVLVAFLGIVGGAALIAAGLTRSSSPSTSATHRVAKASEIQGIGSRNEASGTEGVAEGPSAAAEDPTAAAAEQYRNDSYPAPYTPFQLTRNAQKAWVKAKARGVGNGPNTPGSWALAGPSTANFPSVITFSGASYTTSGRITALAVDPNCRQSQCRVWAAAAGGGVWRTDNALSGNGANWTFIS